MYAETEKSCRVTGDIRIVVEKLVKSGKRVLVITPLLEDKRRLEKEVGSEKVLVKRVLEAKEAVIQKDIIPNSVIVHNYQIIKDAEMLPIVEEIAKGQIIIMGEEENEELEGYPVVEEKKRRELFEIKAEGRAEKMAVILSLTKIKPIKKICICVESEKEAERIRIFLDAFGVSSEINPKKIKDSTFAIFFGETLLIHTYSLVIDLTKEVESENTVVLRVGEKNSEGAEKFLFLFNKALRYKYRIESVLSLITPHVLSGRRQIDPAVTKHLKGVFRAL